MPENLKLNSDPFGSHMQIIKRVKPNSTILDVGCAEGWLGNYLIKHKNCKLYGIEILKGAAKKALEKGYKKVVVGNIDEIKILPFSKNLFDIVICADVLEHLKNPDRFLKIIRPYLKRRGYLLISIPNIANIYSRLRLLLGRWEYEEAGLFDKTHLRFFTIKTAKEMLLNSGFKVEEIDHTTNLSPNLLFSIFKKQKAKSTFSILKTKLKFFLKLRYYLSKIYPRLFAIQFIIKAKK